MFLNSIAVGLKKETSMNFKIKSQHDAKFPREYSFEDIADYIEESIEVTERKVHAV